MELFEFKQNVSVIKEDEMRRIREMYCSSFFNTSSTDYKTAIERMQNYSDGFCYTGYLWDYLSTPIQIELDYLFAKVRNYKDIYVLWDIHSCERIFIEEYWKFGKEDVLLLDGNTLVEALHLLPDGIYIFDSSYKWTAILTHEYLENRRYCLESLPL